MAVEIYRIDDGYVGQASPPHVSHDWSAQEPIARQALVATLDRLGMDFRDVDVLIRSADRTYELGLNDRVRQLEAVKKAIREGTATPTDLDDVRSELLDHTSQLDKVRLIGILRLAGYAPASQSALERVLEQTSERDAAVAILEVISQWSPAKFEEIAPKYFAYDANSSVRGRAMAYAGNLLRRGMAPTLLARLARMAVDPDAPPTARRDARNALAIAAECDADEAERLLLGSDDSLLASVVKQLRRRMRLKND